MKAILTATLLLLCQQLYASCEATIIFGSHTAIDEDEAKAGAWEEAQDSCYPGQASKMSLSCNLVSGDQKIQGNPTIRCEQEASCTICGDALTRKYEALD